MSFPTWLIFALISPAFWAIVHVMDAYCVDELFDRPWVGIVTSSLVMAMLLPGIGCVLLFQGWSPMSWTEWALCILCGFVFMASQVFYFQALDVTESGIVAAYWNIIPLLLAIVGYMVFGQMLTGYQILGAVVLIVSSVVLCLLDGSLDSRWSAFGMMFIGAWLQVVYFIAQDRLFESCQVYQGFFVITVSMVITGFLPLLVPRYRRTIRLNWPRVKPALGLLMGIEIANLIAVGTSQYAVSHGTPSLVSAVEASIPAYTFLLSLILFAITRKYGEQEAKHRIGWKIAMVALMVVGVWLVS